MKHKGGRKPLAYSVEMGQWIHRNWIVNTTGPPISRSDNPTTLEESDDAVLNGPPADRPS